jgi:hypothetical protein
MGFANLMIARSRENRKLLKAQNATCSALDKKYRADSIISRELLKFKESSKTYMRSLKNSLKREKEELRIKKILIFVVSAIIGIAAVSLAFI